MHFIVLLSWFFLGLKVQFDHLVVAFASLRDGVGRGFILAGLDYLACVGIAFDFGRFYLLVFRPKFILPDFIVLLGRCLLCWSLN
jgi:hypothetical protein